LISIFSRNVRNVCPLRRLPTLTKIRTLRTLPTLRDGGNQELWSLPIVCTPVAPTADTLLHIKMTINSCECHQTYHGEKSPRFIGLILKLITARSEQRQVLFSAPSVCGFLFVYEISREPLNGFAPNSHGRRKFGFLARTSLKVKVKVKVTFFGPFGSLRVWRKTVQFACYYYRQTYGSYMAGRWVTEWVSGYR